MFQDILQNSQDSFQSQTIANAQFTTAFTRLKEIMFYSEWKVVFVIQLVLYIIIFTCFIIVTFVHMRSLRKINNLLLFFITISTCLILKIVESITSLVFLSNNSFSNNKTLFVFICILDTISSAIIIFCILLLTQRLLKQQDHSKLVTRINRSEAFLLSDFDSNSQSRRRVVSSHRNKYHRETNSNSTRNFTTYLFWIAICLLVIAIVLEIVGFCRSIHVIHKSTNPMIQTSSILYLMSILLTLVIIIYILINFFTIQSSSFLISLNLLLLCSFCLLVRTVYMILTSYAGFRYDKENEYIMFYGDYKYYAFLTLLPEVLSSIVIFLAYSRWYA